MTQAQGNIDKVLLIAVMLLLAIGVVMVYTSSSVVALTTYNDPTYFMRRQIIWAALGLVLMMAAMRVDHEVLANKRVVAVLLLVSFALLAATFFPGVGRTVNGAQRWIKAGPLTFQPAELVKFTLVVYLSSYLSSRKEHIRDFQRGLLPAFAVTGTLLGLVQPQPDFGTVMAMGVVIMFMLLAGGARITHLGLVSLAAALLAFLAIAQKAYIRL